MNSTEKEIEMETTYQKVNDLLPQFPKKWRWESKAANTPTTHFGPEFHGCSNGKKPMLHGFCTAVSGSVFFVGLMGNWGLEEQMRLKFYEIAEPIGKKAKKIRSLDYLGHKVRVFYTRKSAVMAYAKLIDERIETNRQVQKEEA